MNNPQQSWQRLIAAARAQRDSRDETAPFGFSGRVVAQAFAAAPLGSWGLLEKFAFRGLIAASTLCLAAVVFGFTAWSGEHDDEIATADTVAEILDLS